MYPRRRAIARIAQQSSGDRSAFPAVRSLACASPTNPSDVANKACRRRDRGAISGIPLVPVAACRIVAAANAGTSVMPVICRLDHRPVQHQPRPRVQCQLGDFRSNLRRRHWYGRCAGDNPTGIGSIVMADQFCGAAACASSSFNLADERRLRASVGLVGTNFTGAATLSLALLTRLLHRQLGIIDHDSCSGRDGHRRYHRSDPERHQPNVGGRPIPYTSNCDTSTGSSISVSGSRAHPRICQRWDICGFWFMRLLMPLSAKYRRLAQPIRWEWRWRWWWWWQCFIRHSPLPLSRDKCGWGLCFFVNWQEKLPRDGTVGRCLCAYGGGNGGSSTLASVMVSAICFGRRSRRRC